MSTSTLADVQMLRAEPRQPAEMPVVARLWQAMLTRWQRRQDRVTAQAVLECGHDGVMDDYRMACETR